MEYDKKILIDKINDEYNLLINEMQEIGHINNQITYHAFSKQGEFFVKLFQRRFATKFNLRNRYYVMECLLRKEVNISQLIKTKQKCNCTFLEDKCLEIYEWNNFVPINVQNIDFVFEQLIYIFKAYDTINISNNLNHNLIRKYKDCFFSFYKNIGLNYEYDNIFLPYISRSDFILLKELFFNTKKTFIKYKELLDKLDIKYIHGDMNLTNLVFYENKMYLLDFDTTRLGFRIEDISFAIFHLIVFMNENRIQIDRLNFLYKGLERCYPYIDLKLLFVFILIRCSDIINNQLNCIIKKLNPTVIKYYMNGLKYILEQIIDENLDIKYKLGG